MGFFSDLKQDLSQAVNEMMPGENAGSEDLGHNEMDPAGEAAQETAFGETADGAESVSSPEMTEESSELEQLAIMLDKLEQEEAKQERTQSYDAPADDVMSEEAVPEEAILEEAVPEETTLEEAVSEETTPEEAISEEAIPEEAISEEAILEEAIPEAAIVEEAIPEETVQEEEPAEEIEEETEQEQIKNKDQEGEKKMQEQFFGDQVAASDEKSVITEGMSITGDIMSKGSLEILGTITGNIDILGKLDVTGTINGNSKAAEIYAESAKIIGEVHSLGSVKVGQSSVIIGNIAATSAVIAGAVKGDIDVKGPVILDTSAIVMGNIKSKSVQINNGAVIEGLCSQCYADVNPSTFFDEFKKTTKK